MAMSFLGSGGKTRQEQAEEFVGVDFDGDLGVGLEFGFGRIGGGQAGFERRRTANGAVGVAEGLSGGEFAGGFDFHEKIFQSDYGRVDELRDGERIVHRESIGIAGLVQAVEIGAEDFAGGLADGILRGFEGADLFFADDDLAGDVEADHGERNAGIEDDARGLGINVEIVGSDLRTVATLVSGPMATMEISSGLARTMRRMSSVAVSETGLSFGSGKSTPPRPLLPCAYLAVTRRRTRGVAAPAATGMSVRPAISTRRSALGRVSERGTLPQTGVTASTWSSGERRARKMAMASSTPGSVSRMMRWGLVGVEELVVRFVFAEKREAGRAPAASVKAEVRRKSRRLR